MDIRKTQPGKRVPERYGEANTSSNLGMESLTDNSSTDEGHVSTQSSLPSDLENRISATFAAVQHSPEWRALVRYISGDVTDRAQAGKIIWRIVKASLRRLVDGT